MHWPCWLCTWGVVSSLTKMLISQSALCAFASAFTLVMLAWCVKCQRSLKRTWVYFRSHPCIILCWINSVLSEVWGKLHAKLRSIEHHNAKACLCAVNHRQNCARKTGVLVQWIYSILQRWQSLYIIYNWMVHFISFDEWMETKYYVQVKQLCYVIHFASQNNVVRIMHKNWASIHYQ